MRLASIQEERVQHRILQEAQRSLVERQRECAEFLLGSPLPNSLRLALRHFIEHEIGTD